MNLDTTKPVRVGLLGCSDIARRKFLPALQGCTGAVLAAVASRSPERARGFAAGSGAAVLDYEGLLRAADVDLVYLSLPNDLHEEWTLRSLAAGKDVICEKPLGLGAASVERMLAAAEASGRLLFENLMFLHHPQHAVVRELLAAGRIGRLRTLRSVFAFPRPAAGNFRLDPARGGGALHDLCRYPLATALYFLDGELHDFTGLASRQRGLDVGWHGLARSADGVVLSFAIAFGQVYESYYELVGETGKIRLDRAYTTPADLANRIVLSTGGAEVVVTAPAADHSRLMLEQVCALMRGGRDFRQVHERSRRLAWLAEAMQKGCRDGD